MTNLNNITKFLQNGTHESFQYIYNCYADCLQMKTATFQNQKNKQDLIKLDEWIHNELPLKIQARKPEPHIVHEELINIVKWKLLRTCVKNNNNKNLKNLIIMNSPRLVMTETKKAFKVLMKKDNIQMALSYLTNLKGITLTTATLIISLIKPYPYMSDECIESIPEIYSLNYSITNYLALINYFKNISSRLNGKWTNRTLEHIIWIYQMLLVNKSYDLLLNIPEGGGSETSSTGENGAREEIVGATLEDSSDSTLRQDLSDGSSEEVKCPEQDCKDSEGIDIKTDEDSKEFCKESEENCSEIQSSCIDESTEITNACQNTEMTECSSEINSSEFSESPAEQPPKRIKLDF